VADKLNCHNATELWDHNKVGNKIIKLVTMEKNSMSFENSTDTNPNDLAVYRFAIAIESSSNYLFAFVILCDI